MARTSGDEDTKVTARRQFGVINPLASVSWLSAVSLQLSDGNWLRQTRKKRPKGRFFEIQYDFSRIS